MVWIPKYRKRVLVGPVAVRKRDLLRQIAMERGRVVLGEGLFDSAAEHPTRLPRVDLTGAGLRLKDVTLRYGGPPGEEGELNREGAG